MTNNFLIRYIISTEGKKELGRELIIKESPEGKRFETASREGSSIVEREYHYCGEWDEIEKGRYNPRDGYYAELNMQLLGAGL